MHLAFVLLLLLPQSRPADDSALTAAFAKLDPDKKRAILDRVAAEVTKGVDPRRDALRKLAATTDTLPEATLPPIHDPRTYADGVAPERKQITDPDARKRYPALPVLADLVAGVQYDFGSGKVVRRRMPLTSDERLQNFLHGHPDGADAALAFALRALDADKKQRPAAEYFGHTYCDLQAQAFVGVTLYEVWFAGRELDIPDVDSVAYARKILHDTLYVSPIPKGQRRTNLYQKIAAGFGAFREYRTEREAAAGTFLSADPALHPTYKPLADRFHWLFATHDEDPAAVAAVLAGFKDRKAFLATVDKQMKDDEANAWQRVNDRKKAWQASVDRIRAAALAALAAEGVK